jgi:hypothetical protein
MRSEGLPERLFFHVSWFCAIGQSGLRVARYAGHRHL